MLIKLITLSSVCELNINILQDMSSFVGYFFNQFEEVAIYVNVHTRVAGTHYHLLRNQFILSLEI